MGVFTLQSLLSPQAPLSQALQTWMMYEESLTDKLRLVSGSSELELLVQGFVRTDWWTKAVLQVSDPQVFKREIIMRSNGVPYWYARTFIPESCFHLEVDFFNRLYRETMRELIFNEPQVTLIDRFTYAVDKHCLEFYWVKNVLPESDGILWLRLSHYAFQEKAYFYLIEVFLASMEDLE
jgi:chorismate--pyruvate lyase